MKSALITGGAGFIGTHLCRKLTQQNIRVTVLDLKKAKTPVEGVEYHIGDVRDPSVVENLLQKVDVVYHLAAIVSVPLCQEMPIEGYQTNLIGTVTILEKIQKIYNETQKKIKIVFASSFAVYGDQGRPGLKIDESMSETHTTQNLLSLYGAQKLGSEHAISLFCKSLSLPAVIFRFANVYGPGQDPSSPYSGVISIFTKRITEGLALTLNGGGIQTRDFVSVHDVAEGLLLAGLADSQKSDAKPINLGTSKEISIKDLAQMVMKIKNKPVEVSMGPSRAGDILYSCAENKRAHDVLGWRPQVTLEQGLSELILS